MSRRASRLAPVRRADRLGASHQFTFELYGVRARIGADSLELLEEVKARLPTESRTVASRGNERRYAISRTVEGDHAVAVDGWVAIRDSKDSALRFLDAELRGYLAVNAAGMVFIHAGAVGVGDRAVVIPGLSGSGKTTLVAALVRAGASYLSDECAVLDRKGLTHPFVKPLGIRAQDGTSEDRDVASLGGTVAPGALPVGLIVMSRYRAGAEWQPRSLSPGDAVLALLPHAAVRRDRAGDTLTALRRAVQDAVVVSGDRGEAEALVPGLLELLR